MDFSGTPTASTWFYAFLIEKDSDLSVDWGFDITGSDVTWIATNRIEPTDVRTQSMTIVLSGVGLQRIELNLGALFTGDLQAGERRYDFQVIATLPDSTNIVLISNRSKMTVLRP